MKKGFYQDLEKEWKRLKRLRFFYFVMPDFLTMLCIRIIQVYFHLKLEQVKRQAALFRRETENTPAVPVPVPSENAGAEFITPEPVGEPVQAQPVSCTVTEE